MNTDDIFRGAVVVGVDGSASALRAVAWAADQAQLERRRLTVVHAGTDLAAIDASVLAVRRRHRDLEIRGTRIGAPPRKTLVAATARAHLVVVGSRGRGPASTRVLGSVSAAVARDAVGPVVVVRPSRPGLLRDGVLLGADLTGESRPVVEFAFEQASWRRLPLTVLHCQVLDDLAVEDRDGRLMSELLAGMREKYPDVHVTKRFAAGDVATCLTKTPRPWDLIVVGRRQVDGLARWVDQPSASSVLVRSASPVAIVPEAVEQAQ